jgi:hypothetical protein
MKVVISGHMNGLGLALSNIFEGKGYTISGYDLLNDKDLNNTTVIEELISDCIDADIFVNNALPNQSLLLTRVFNLWIGKEKTIINISSAITYFPNAPITDIDLSNYIASKKTLDRLVEFNRERSPFPYIMNVRPCWFESEMVKDFNTKKMNPNDIANLVVMMYDMREAVRIADIVLEK